LKLDLVSPKGDRLIQPHQRDEDEIHYMQIESYCQRIHLDFTSALKVVKEAITRNNTLEFEEWIITDFDHALKGNKITG